MPHGLCRSRPLLRVLHLHVQRLCQDVLHLRMLHLRRHPRLLCWAMLPLRFGELIAMLTASFAHCHHLLVGRLYLAHCESALLYGQFHHVKHTTPFHLVSRQDACLHLCPRCLTIELAADAHELRPPIAVRRVPVSLPVVGHIMFVVGPVLPWDRSHPWRAGREGELRAGEGREDPLVGYVPMPHGALEPQEVGQRTRARPNFEGGAQTHRVEGPPRAEDEGGDAVLERLRRVLVLARLGEPVWVLLGVLWAEACRAEQLLRLEHAVLRAYDLGGLV
mmetsp:Transcript_47477/g.101366  ORF Transcript_47477/g.101366 Transcript_47477/m.101366 type:complete len:277 (+) Transcript_47477:229-1059(+)